MTPVAVHTTLTAHRAAVSAVMRQRHSVRLTTNRRESLAVRANVIRQRRRRGEGTPFRYAGAELERPPRLRPSTVARRAATATIGVTAIQVARIGVCYVFKLRVECTESVRVPNSSHSSCAGADCLSFRKDVPAAPPLLSFYLLRRPASCWLCAMRRAYIHLPALFISVADGVQNDDEPYHHARPVHASLKHGRFPLGKCCHCGIQRLRVQHVVKTAITQSLNEVKILYFKQI